MSTSGSGEAKVTGVAKEIAPVANGSGAISFEELAGSARPSLVRTAQGVTGRREDAEDAVQSSLLKAMRAWPRVAGQERWRQQAYVRQIVVNTCRSGWRKWGSRIASGEMPELARPAGTDSVDDRELLRRALAKLPPRQREVLLLRYYEDLTEAEIANRLGCAPGTVKSSAARALRALRDMLPEYADVHAFTTGGAGTDPGPAAAKVGPSGPEALKSA